MKLKLGFIGLVVPAVFVVAIVVGIKMGPHTVIFAEAETGEVYANADIEVIYTRFCVSSPCGPRYASRTIFSGITDDAGSVRLWGHSANDINFEGQGDRSLEYTIVIEGQSYQRLDKDMSDHRKIFLVPSDDYDVEFSQNNVTINFNWDHVRLLPSTDVAIGEVLYMELSPNERFLYIRTGQGGGFGGIVYDRETQIAHILGGQVEIDKAWQEDGTLRLYSLEYFGENAGQINETYHSTDGDRPWNLIAD